MKIRIISNYVSIRIKALGHILSGLVSFPLLDLSFPLPLPALKGKQLHSRTTYQHSATNEIK